MKAVMVKDDYIDLVPGVEYEIIRVYKDYHIKLEGSQRRYHIGSFQIKRNGKTVLHKDAYRIFKKEACFK